MRSSTASPGPWKARRRRPSATTCRRRRRPTSGIPSMRRGCGVPSASSASRRSPSRPSPEAGVRGMAEIRKADPGARRRALLLLAVGTLVGALLIAGWERYRLPFRDWLVSEPEKTAHRARLVFVLLAIALSAPPAAFAARLWRLGAAVRRARQFPPPGYRVIRDTPVVEGPAARAR